MSLVHGVNFNQRCSSGWDSTDCGHSRSRAVYSSCNEQFSLQCSLYLHLLQECYWWSCLESQIFDVTRDKLVHMTSFHFQVPGIATMLGQWCVGEEGTSVYCLSTSSSYSVILDVEQTGVMKAVKESYSMCGEKILNGHFWSKGITVHSQKLFSALQVMDIITVTNCVSVPLWGDGHMILLVDLPKA